MEYQKKEIRIFQNGRTVNDQFYIDGDYNVPEAKRDVFPSFKCAEHSAAERRFPLNHGRLQTDIPVRLFRFFQAGQNQGSRLPGKI